jgi:AcrR family transcriptional regulator
MPRTEEANQRIREEQRAKILDAAMIVFARKGMAATMAEVATTAEVSYGLVYRYFANKETIFAELVERVLRNSIRAIERILEMPGTPEERLHFLLSQALEGLREHPEFVLLTHQVLRDEATPDELRKLVQKQGWTYRAVMRQLIVEGQAAGQVAETDPDQLVAAVSACIGGLSLGLTWQSPEQFKENFPDIEIILGMLNP